MRIAAVTALLVDADRAARISVPAFDSLTEDGRRTLRQGEPLTWLHAMQNPQDHGSLDEALAASASAVHRLLADGAFLPQPTSTFYLYRLSQDDRSQTGLVADIPVAHFDDGTVLPHEGTRPEQVRQLTRHLEVVGVSSSPLAVAFTSSDAIDALMRDVAAGAPLLDFNSSDGLSQQVWSVPAPLVRQFADAFEPVANAYITDGHHRARAAVTYARGQDLSVNGDARADHVLTALFPRDHLHIVEFNRIVHGISDSAPLEAGLVALGAYPIAREQVRPTPRGEVRVFLSGHWFAFALPRDGSLQPPESLDPAILQDVVLAPLLGIDDPASNPRISYVPGSVDMAELEARSTGGAAFVLAPLTFTDITAVSDAGRSMPPKSTYFEPKVRSGIFLTLR